MRCPVHHKVSYKQNICIVNTSCHLWIYDTSIYFYEKIKISCIMRGVDQIGHRTEKIGLSPRSNVVIQLLLTRLGTSSRDNNVQIQRF